MEKAYYGKYYHYEREHWWFVVRGQIIRDRVAKLTNGQKDLKILNVGVATGRTSEILSEFGEVTSIEYDEECCEFLRSELNFEVTQASITELPYEDNCYDMVFALDVVEHVEDDQLAVSEMYRVCKNEGTIFITVPAFMTLWSQHDVVNHHFRRYKRKQLLKLFNPLKGKTTTKTYFNTCLFPPIFLIRLISKPFSKKSKAETGSSDLDKMNVGALNFVAKLIFSIERPFLKFMRFAYGVSIMASFKKTDG